MLLSTRDLKWQIVGQRLEKLIEQLVGLYRIKTVISSNVVKLNLPACHKLLFSTKSFLLFFSF